MRLQIFLLAILLYGETTLAQKKYIENDTYNNWDELVDYNISNDGEHIWYRFFCRAKGYKLVVKSIDENYNEFFEGATSKPLYSNDSKGIFFIISDTLYLLNLIKKEKVYIPGVKWFSIPKNGNGRWLSYQDGKGIVLRDLLTGRENLYAGATAGYFNDQGTIFIIQDSTSLFWITLSDLSKRCILKEKHAENICFDNTGKQLAFSCRSQDGINLYYYSSRMPIAVSFVTSLSKGVPSHREISNEPIQFSADGEKLFFKLGSKKGLSKEDQDIHLLTSKLDIWHYKDESLQSQQLEEISSNRDSLFWAVSSIEKGYVEQIEGSKQLIQGGIGKDLILMYNRIPEKGSFANEEVSYQYYIVSVKDNSKKIVIDQPSDVLQVSISPNERFILWYDLRRKHYFTYEVATGLIRNITESIEVPLNYENVDREETALAGVAGWFNNDSSLLIYDQYDVWLVDPTSKTECISITKGYGKKSQILFRIAEMELKPFYRSFDTLILVGWDTRTQNNGFWGVKLNSKDNPIRYTMGPYIYYFPYLFVGAPPPPLKSKDANIYLIQRMSAVEAPNLYMTRNFKEFTKLSDIQPQKKINWMKTELVHWNISHKKMGSGILYKPENFDSTKRYPIIFNFYEKRSKELNKFLAPNLSAGGLNIPWYVSHEYLVFVPDIRHPLGKPGESAANTIISAAKYLIQFPWIDGTKMGLQGHSYGGYETNYTVTKTTVFAAAQSSAGIADLISGHGSLGFGGRSLAFPYEIGQLRLGCPPWENPNLYIDNSPIFHVRKIETPLLLIHNSKDAAVSFSQSVELFIALRRLRKRVWLLQYDGEGHVTTGDPACTLDLNIRQQQFFNHYLKGQAAPIWLTTGRPAALKNKESGLTIDTVDANLLKKYKELTR